MIYFLCCILLSAFLIFQIQPMIAKYILPWFGGTTAVWSTVQMFFQVLLTGGYAYANWLISKSRRREIVHLVLLSLSVITVIIMGIVWRSPVTPGVEWKPASGAAPVWEILKLLTIAVGLPYFLLSTNSPLMQAWSHRRFPEKVAYRLYALSNFGSFLGLITYPIFIEPNLTVAWQGRIWSLLYLIYAGLAIFGTVQSLLFKKEQRTTILEDPSEEKKRISADQKSTIRVKDAILWLLLAMTASILLLATTSHVSQEVAVIPFLWVIPLTIYLITFILAFSGERYYSRKFYLGLLFTATLLYCWALGRPDAALNAPLQLGIFFFALFAACMVCHGELYRLRPPAERLTLFYLIVSIGGAIGGIFITFAAPILFSGYWELPLGFSLCWFLFLLLAMTYPPLFKKRLGFIVFTVLMISGVLISSIRSFQYIQGDLKESILSRRNFYGIVRVKTEGTLEDQTKRNLLVHGITVHGAQYTATDHRSIPTTYYTPSGGGGLAILNHPDRSTGMRVGILGLGIGTLASYAQPNDIYRFYEINPAVIDLAKGEGGYFSYLSDSKGKIEIIPGDARLSLEQEMTRQGSQEYDLLVLDVFSSDSIPSHLLDKEAFELYLQHLQPDGMLAIHITNQYLDLTPVVWGLADHFNLSRIVIRDPGVATASFPSIWMVLAADPELLKAPDLIAKAESMAGYQSDIRLWTDDYSNLFSILK